MASETLRCDVPMGQDELVLLQTIKAGDTRLGLLFPAFDVNTTWLCTARGENYWEFDGRFFGQALCQVAIRLDAGMLVLDIKEAA